jgi:branched-chain amino acid transport system ATP-binding protein
VQKPKVVLVDEPSLGLAPMVVDQIFSFLGRIADAGTTLIIVEQYVHKVLKMTDYVCVMARGRMELSGTPEDLGSTSELLGSYLSA